MAAHETAHRGVALDAAQKLVLLSGEHANLSLLSIRR
jgi:hypothetical protein